MNWITKLTRWFFVALFGGFVLATLAVMAGYAYVAPSLPGTASLREVTLEVPLRVRDRNGALIAEYGEKRREPLTFDQIPTTLRQAFLAAEDDRFYEHPGVDYQGIVRAVGQLILTGERRQGGSTITMQLARNIFLTPERTYVRKLKEVFLALQMERDLDKDEILTLYLNKIYLGNRAYGVGAAAKVYYGKAIGELELPQWAMIAGLPKAPSRYNPIADPERAKVRRNYVLRRMHDLGQIDEPSMLAAQAAPVTARLHSAAIEVAAPYAAEMVRAELFERYGEAAYSDGFEVITTLDGRLQNAALAALRAGLVDYDRRHGWRGPEHRSATGAPDTAALDALLANAPRVGDLLPALVTSVDPTGATLKTLDGQQVELGVAAFQWARPYVDADHIGTQPKSPGEVVAAGDLVRVARSDDETGWVLAQVPKVEGALVSSDADTGAIQAIVGGYDFFRSKFNRADHALRQAGTGFKPILYSAALDHGYTPASIINDAPITIRDAALEGVWRPENYGHKFKGPTRLREALAQSRNLVSIRLLQAVGVAPVIEQADRFGLDTARLPHNLSLALGSGEVTPLDLNGAYAVFANGGFRVEPYLVEQINRAGVGVYRATPRVACRAGCTPDQPRAARVLDARTHYLISSMLREVVQSGTARRARSLGRRDLAGKTGTSNDYRDAWFNGYVPGLITTVWIGFDDNAELGRGEAGGRAALPVWIDYMRVALNGRPERDFPEPPGIVNVRIDPDTGLAATAGQTGTIVEIFRSDQLPRRSADGANTIAPPPSPGTSATPKPVENLF